MLKRRSNRLYHYIDGVQVGGPNKDMRGNCTGLSGNCTGLWGDCTGLSGDLDKCGITQEMRAAGVDIASLVAES